MKNLTEELPQKVSESKTITEIPDLLINRIATRTCLVKKLDDKRILVDIGEKYPVILKIEGYYRNQNR